MMSQTIEATPPDLHSGQIEVIKALEEKRFIIAVCGRRWGKTTLSLVAAVDQALKGLKVWVIFPVYPQALESWLNLKSLVRQLPEEYAEIREVEKRIVLKNGGSIQIKSANKPETLRGAGGISLIIFDEVAYQDKETWETVRPILSDSLGKALFISTPNGMNWFYELFDNAKRRKDWAVFHYPTENSPRINKDELAQAKEELGSLVYAQEFLAEFTEVGHMFKREWFAYYDVLDGEDPEYVLEDEVVKHSELSIFGTMDTALSIKETADYSVIMAVGSTPSGKLLVLDIFRDRLEAPELLPKIESMISKWNMAWLGVEDSSFGLGIIQMARRQGLPIRNLKADKSKTARAVPAAAGCENGTIYFLKNAKWLVEFERELTSFPSSGSHDDQVDALAYAARFGIVRKTTWSVT
jgi:predicted phage terminase large subunit-like protein